MTPEQRHQEAQDIVDDLESNHNADSTEVHRARLKIALLATEKLRHDFHSAMVRIWWSLAQKCGIRDPKEYYNSFKDVAEEL